MNKIQVVINWNCTTLWSATCSSNSSSHSLLSLASLCMRHRCVKQLSEERLNKQAGQGTKSPPLRDMWQQNPLNPRPPPTHPSSHNGEPLTLLPEPHKQSHIPRAWSQEKERWRRRRGSKFWFLFTECHHLTKGTAWHCHQIRVNGLLSQSCEHDRGRVYESKGVWEKNGGWWSCLFAPLKGHMGQMSLVWYSESRLAR